MPLAFTNDPNDPNVTTAVIDTAFKVNSGTIAGTFGTLLPLLRTESERQVNVVRALLHSVKSGEIEVKLAALQILYEYLRFRGRQERPITRSVEKYYDLIQTLHQDWYRNPDPLRARISALSGLVLLHIACSSQLNHLSPPPPRLFRVMDTVNLLNTAQTTEELCFASATLGVLVEFDNLPGTMAELNVFPIMKHKLVHLLPAFLNHDFSMENTQFKHELSLTSTLANMFLAFSLLLKYPPFYQGRFAVVNDIRLMNLLSLSINKFDTENLYGQQLFRVSAFAIVGNCASEAPLRSIINKKYGLFPTVIRQYFFSADPSTSMFQGGTLLNILETADCPILNDMKLGLHVLKQITDNTDTNPQYIDNTICLLDAMVHWGTKGPIIGAFMGKIGFINNLIHNHIANGSGEVRKRAASIVNRCLKNSKVIVASGVGPSEVNVLVAFQMCTGRLLVQLDPKLLPLEYDSMEDLPEYRCQWPCCEPEKRDIMDEPAPKSFAATTMTTTTTVTTDVSDSSSSSSGSGTTTTTTARTMQYLNPLMSSSKAAVGYPADTDVTQTIDTSEYADSTTQTTATTTYYDSTYATSTPGRSQETSSESVFLTTAFSTYTNPFTGASAPMTHGYSMMNPMTSHQSYNPTELVTGYSYAPHSVFSTEDSTTRSSTMSSSTSGYSSTDSESTTKMTDTFSEKVRGSHLSSTYYSSASATQPVSQAQNSYMPSYLRDSFQLESSSGPSSSTASSLSTSSAGLSSLSSSSGSSSSSSRGYLTSGSNTRGPYSHGGMNNYSSYQYGPQSHMPTSYVIYE